MDNKNINLTENEWYVLECLWESFPRTGREAVDHLNKKVGWNRSTTLTMLRRMTEKGLIRCDESGEVKVYYPLVEREAAARKETENFLDRIYNGSLSLLVSAFTEKQNLSKEEIDELYSILQKAEEAQK
ncbi:MAG: BlaI/MecI/CopY family transcriptional regulator [Oscillospiraceae bacterium]|nr:BlaI/MecI/CopY family transcriptional regulator [Oscillospiraceae bacterium]